MNILVVYYNNRYPLRTSVQDHLLAIRRHGRCRSAYVNVATTRIGGKLTSAPFDAIVFHTTLLSTRWDLKLFARISRACAPLKRSGAVRMGLPQDEFIHTTALAQFITDFDLAHVFSVAPATEWPTIYADVDRSKVQFHEVLTGYLEDATIRRIERLRQRAANRSIDIGYRAWRAEPWLGRHGLLKTRIAEVIAERAPRHGLSTDISTREEDTMWGDDWLRHLLRCKYTIGVEGGASVLDPTGAIRQRTNAYVARHPEASFEEVERVCFPGVDGNLRLFALSPRHLEACATRTCQVLVRGRYNGVLRADEHYIPLEPDFSNVDDVLRTVANDRRRAEITERAYRDIVQSEACTYRTLVDQILTAVASGPTSDGTSPTASVIGRIDAYDRIAHARLALRWRFVVPVSTRLHSLARTLIPRPVRMVIHRTVARLRK